MGDGVFNVTGNKAGNTTIKTKKVYVLENCPKDLVCLVKLRRESTRPMNHLKADRKDLI